jgi:aerobic carbon-monoxide dehydrogenase medium subunit
MYPAEFSYHRASSVGDAIDLLAQQPEAKLLAGGHSLLPAMKLRLSSPPALIDLADVRELRGIRWQDGTLVIGALTTHREIELSNELKRTCPILPETAAVIGDPLVRNRGTLGGSLAHADPGADFPAAMLALAASFDVQSTRGSRTIAAADFFQGLFTTALQPGELLTTIRVPSSTSIAMAYEKFPHPASRYAIVGVAAVVTVADGKCRSARVAVTGAAPHAMRLPQLEAALVGKPLDAATLASTCQHVIAQDDLLNDPVASAEYRAHLVDVLAKRALTRAAART